MSFTAEIAARIGWAWNDGALDSDDLRYAVRLLEGNGESQAEAVWHKEDVELLSGASETLDLTALVRTILGEAVTFTFLTIKGLLITVDEDSTGELLVGGAASNAWYYPWSDASDKSNVPAGSPFLIGNRHWGWAVDASNKNLKLEASGGDVTYSIAIVGTTATTASGSSGS